jgi:hypothetical protein
VFERGKTVHALDRAATVLGNSVGIPQANMAEMCIPKHVFVKLYTKVEVKFHSLLSITVDGVEFRMLETTTRTTTICVVITDRGTARVEHESQPLLSK